MSLFDGVSRRERIAAMAGATPLAVAIVVWGFGYPLVETAAAVVVGLALVGAGAAYLRRHDMLDVALVTVLRWFVDLRRPTRREWGWIAVVVVLGLFTDVAVNLAVALVETPRAGHGSAGAATDVGGLTLAAFAVFAVVVGPAMEELLFRNGAQKIAAEWTGAWPAILGVSVVFAAFHIPSYGGLGQPAITLAPALVAVFINSALYGWAYHRTGNVSVAILGHGGHNAVALVSLVV